MPVENLLKKTVRRQCKGQHTAILFTGGLDSTILALLARPQKPLLIFAAVEAPECLSYNRTSIALSKKIASSIGLQFQVVKISNKDYLRHFPGTIKLMNRPIFDRDLPAVSHLLETLKKIGISSVLSGMGSDEIFCLPRTQLRSFISQDAKTTLQIHRKIARQNGISFHCPYFSTALIKYGLTTPLAQRKNKQALTAILKEHPALFALLQNHPTAHSTIPEHFWTPLALLLGRMNPRRGIKDHFKKTVSVLWRQRHPAKKLADRKMRSR